MITPGFALKARYIIHTVGPIWSGGARGEPDLLRSAYSNSFARAIEVGARSIAFPCVSTGVYGYPKDLAAQVALGVMREHENEFDRIVACVFSAEDKDLYEAHARRP